MKLIIIALVVLIILEIVDRLIWLKIKKPDPPESPGPDAQKAAKQYSDWLNIKSPSHAVYLEFGHGVLTPKEQQEVILQAVKDYAEKEGIKVTYSKGEPQECPAGFFEELSIHKDPKPMPLRLQYNGKKGENHEETETTD